MSDDTIVSLFPCEGSKTEIETRVKLINARLEQVMDEFRLSPSIRNTVRDHFMDIKTHIDSILTMLNYTEEDARPIIDFSNHNVFLLVAMLGLHKDALRTVVESHRCNWEPPWRSNVIEYTLKLKNVLEAFEKTVGL